MISSFKWGILGASKFALEQMAPAIHSAKGNSLVALATRDLEKANKFLELSDRLVIYNDYNDLLEDSNVDAVYIPLPNHIHIEWATRCLQAGKHVLCEKPISMAADEIDRLIHLRDKAQLLAAEAYMVVHHPQWQLAKEFVDAGKLGKLVQIDGVFSYNNADDPLNIRNQARFGGGGIPDIGVYPYGVSRFVTGSEPIEVLSADIVFENDDIIVIKDINPQAKTHLLIIPKKEILTINDITPQDSQLIADMFLVAKDIAKKLEIQEGYKLHFNV